MSSGCFRAAAPWCAPARLKKIAVATAALAVLAPLAACSGPGDASGPAVGPTTAQTSAPQPSADPTQPSGSATTAVPEPSVPAPTATGSPTVVDPRPVQTTQARLDAPKDLGNGVRVEVTKVKSVTGEAHGPGEVAGPALQVTVTISNSTRTPLSTDLAVANLYYGSADTPASSLSGPGVTALPATIKPGSSGSGRYVYSVPKADRDTVKVEFSYTTAAPTVVFSGKPVDR